MRIIIVLLFLTGCATQEPCEYWEREEGLIEFIRDDAAKEVALQEDSMADSYILGAYVFTPAQMVAQANRDLKRIREMKAQACT